MLAFQQLVESVEELFLRALFSRKKLDVVDQERIERAVRGLELVHRVMLKSTHHVTDETLRMHVSDARLRIIFLDQVCNGVHEGCVLPGPTPL